MSRKNLLLKFLSKKNKRTSLYLFLFLVILLSITLTSFNKNNNLTIISSGLQFLSGSTTVSCPAKIDVFDYNLIVGKTARVKAISNKPGRIEIFAKGLTGITTTTEFVKLKTCDFPGFGVNFCEYYSDETSSGSRNGIPIPVTSSGSIVQYYAELTAYNPFEFVKSVTKLAPIGDQGNTNNFCADENSIVLGGGANSLGVFCTSAGPGKCNPGYCSRSYSGTGSVSCFYPDNCIANDALFTLVSCSATSSTLSKQLLQCPIANSENPSILGCLSSFIPPNAIEKQGYGCTPDTDAFTGNSRKCYECPAGLIRGSGTFASCIQTVTPLVTVPTMQCPATGTDPTFIGCRPAQVEVTNAEIYPNGGCTSPNACFKCFQGYVSV